jgi:hypothetical protein
VSRQPLPHSFWRYLKATFIFLIVSWHLLFLAVRNPLDLWDANIKKWLVKRKLWQDPNVTEEQRDAVYNVRPIYRFWDELTERYASATGTTQKWVMFTPPMATRAPFLGVRLEFADGTSFTMPSDNEPADPASFLRIGGWQTRKFEDCLMDLPEDQGPSNPEWPIWEAYIRHKVREWRRTYPDMDHEPVRVVMVKRIIRFPGPFEPANHHTYGETVDLVTFTPQGKLVP